MSRVVPGGPPRPPRGRRGRGVLFGMLMVNTEHRTSDIQLPTSKGRAKPPKATPKPGTSREPSKLPRMGRRYEPHDIKPPQGATSSNGGWPSNCLLSPTSGTGGTPALLYGAGVDPPVETVQAEQGKAFRRRLRHTGQLHRLELPVVHDFDPTGDGAVGEVDDDDELVLVIQAHDSDQVCLIGVVQPDDPVVAECRVLSAHLDQPLVNLAQGRTLLRMPEDRQLLEQG